MVWRKGACRVDQNSGKLNIMPLISYFFQLIVAHAVADFVLQQEAMVLGKNRQSEIHNKPGNHFPAWYYWLTAHSLVHGGAVYLVTGNLIFGVIEVLLHWIIDYSKCEGWVDFHQDQALHIGCKIAYCFLI